MSIPVIPEHIAGENCIGCPDLKGDECQRIGKCPDCAPDCPRCLAIKWARYFKANYHCMFTVTTAFDLQDTHVLISIPIADWQAIKQLAEEETK